MLARTLSCRQSTVSLRSRGRTHKLCLRRTRHCSSAVEQLMSTCTRPPRSPLRACCALCVRVSGSWSLLACFLSYLLARSVSCPSCMFDCCLLCAASRCPLCVEHRLVYTVAPTSPAKTIVVLGGSVRVTAVSVLVAELAKQGGSHRFTHMLIPLCTFFFIVLLRCPALPAPFDVPSCGP